METVDQAAEWRRLEELYRSKSDEELELIAADADDLTDLAKDVLQRELASRGLKFEHEAAAPSGGESEGNFQHEPSELVLEVVRIVWNIEDARRVKRVLDDAGLPCLFGPDNDADVDSCNEDWSKGVEVKTDSYFRERAQAVVWNSEPPVSDDSAESVEVSDSDIRCPKCHSDGVIFEDLEKESAKQPDFQAKYRWVCDDCGHEWIDDGVEK